MVKFKKNLQRWLRDSGLLRLGNSVRFLLNSAKYYPANKKFAARNPGFVVPPRALAFDAYSASDWNFYQESGRETAAFLASVANKYLPSGKSLRVLEWGCGPGRVIRHIPSAFGSETVHGTDYNSATIAWCGGSLPEVTFAVNQLSPPLPFSAGSFDFVYSISVLTHLSEEVSEQWIEELHRVTAPGGLVVMSTNGDTFKPWLMEDELAAYEKQGFVIRGRFEEGKKLFLAYHSPHFLRDHLFRRFEILDFVSGGFPYTGQDLSVLRKAEGS